MVSEVFRPVGGHPGRSGLSKAWLDHVRAQDDDATLPDSECRSPSPALDHSTLLAGDIQTARNGKRWHDDYAFDHQQAQHVHELKAWGLKQVTIAAIVGLSPSRVPRILSQGL